MKQVKQIRTKEQFRALLDNLMKKDQITIPSIEVDLRFGKYKCLVETTNTPISRVYIKDDVLPMVKVRNSSRIVNICNKFSWAFLSVSITNKAASKAKDILGNSVYLVHGSNGWIKVFSDLGSNGRSFVDLENGSMVSKLPKGTVHIYKGLAWTASNKRKKTMIFSEVTHGDNRYDILNTGTLGAFGMLHSLYGLDEAIETFMALQKAGGYIGNILTGSVDFGVIAGYVRYYSKWEIATNEYFLTDRYNAARQQFIEALRSKDSEKIKLAKVHLDTVASEKESLMNTPTQDGQMYINARVFAQMIYDAFMIEVDPKAITGLMIQLRPGTIKASAVIVSEPVFNSIVEGTKGLANEAIEDAIKKAEGIRAKDGDAAADEYINKVKASQKVQPVGDENNLLYIADKNCIKLDYDMTLDITMQVLAFAKCSEGKTSKQLAETILYAANESGANGSQLLYDILELSIDKKVASLTTDKKARLLTPEEIENGLNTGYVNDIVLSIAPKFIDESKAFFNSTWRQAINSITKMIDKLNGDITSHNRRLSSDPTFIITGGKLNGILNTGEVMINNRKITKTVMIKYPKMGLREFYFAKNVDLKTIKKRLQFHVKKGVITQDEADKVFKFYLEIDSFVAVLPPKAVIAYACAGLDFDYDGALFIEYSNNPKDRKDELTNEIVNLLENTKMKAVVIK